MKLTQAIDLFPTLRGVRAGVDTDAVRSWFFDSALFIHHATACGSGAKACAQFIVSISGERTPAFTLAQLFDKIDTAHQAAALELFAACIAKGGLQ